MKLEVGAILLITPLCIFAEATATPVAGETPQTALVRLKHGNDEYVAEHADVSHRGLLRRRELVSGQHPFAVVLSCADSRVPPELIFNQGLGDLFVIRVAGAVTDYAVRGSVEYAAEHLHTPLVVVMGHTSCGAVKAAMDTPPIDHPDAEHANLEHILASIRPSLPRAPKVGNAWTNAVYSSVEQNVSDLVRMSPVLAHLGEQGKLTFVGAVYDLDTGHVTFSEPVELPHGTPHKAQSSKPVSHNAGAHK